MLLRGPVANAKRVLFAFRGAPLLYTYLVTDTVQEEAAGSPWPWHRSLLVVALGALILVCPAIYNGYPFLYSDTATYLSSGFELETPFDRPITYGLFVRAASLNGLTLWSVVLMQSAALAYVVLLLLRWLRPRLAWMWHVALFALLATTTSVGWVTSQLMPDVFTPILALCLVLLAGGRLACAHRNAVAALFLFSCATHLSHLSFSIASIVALVLLRYLGPRTFRASIAIRPLLGAALLTVLSVLTMGSALSKSKSVFFMGAMAEHGILKTYLDEHCPCELRLCALKDSLPPLAYQFIWDANGPVEKLGGFAAVNDEFADIIQHTLTQPKYIGMHIVASLRAAGEQLLLFRVGDGWGAFDNTTPVAQRIAQYVPGDVARRATSKQQQQRLTALPMLNAWYTACVIIAGALLAWNMFRAQAPATLAVAALLAAVLINAWTCGTFANAIDRLGAKMIWLIPLCSAVALRAMKR